MVSCWTRPPARWMKPPRASAATATPKREDIVMSVKPDPNYLAPLTAPAVELDPVSLELQWRRLITVMDETDKTVVRTAFSTIVGESGDFACVLTDDRGWGLAQSTFSTT